MTIAVRQLINSFEALPAPEQHEATLEILKRAGVWVEGDIAEDVLAGVADEMFCQMDADEASNAAS
ncbi:MAG: hypothetical protein ACR2FY_06590 [Pirellulaceae bacterium]